MGMDSNSGGSGSMQLYIRIFESAKVNHTKRICEAADNRKCHANILVSRLKAFCDGYGQQLGRGNCTAIANI
jgi:hypothetical protein